jgi:hypothetical protein
VVRQCIPASVRGWGHVLCACLVAFCWARPARGQAVDVVLLLQQTPTKGGTIIPGPGVHRFALNSEVTLTAVPTPGYEFLFWLGQVNDPATSRTTARLDKPKIIIAVFERSQYDLPRRAGGAPGRNRAVGGATARSGLLNTAVDFYQPSTSSGGGSRVGTTQSSRGRVIVYDPGVEPPEPPAPLEPPGPPGPPEEPPIPEPATGVLLLMGSLFALRRRGHSSLA